MRIVIALIFLVGGISGLVYGGGQAAGVFDGSPIGALAGGAVAAFLGVVMIRAISSGSTDAPIPAPESLGDHSLTDDEPLVSQPAPRPEGASSSGRRGVLVAVAAAIAMIGALAAVLLVESEAPNVASHIDQACVEERRAVDGPAASIGMIVSYESIGSAQQVVGYETTQGWTWTCTYDWTDQTATVSEVVRP